VFEDDQQLRIVLELIDDFSSTRIDNEEDIENSEYVFGKAQTKVHFNNKIAYHKVIQLKIISFLKA